MMEAEMQISDALPLTLDERRQLETWAKERIARARLVERARILLLLADGLGIRRVPVAAPQVSFVQFSLDRFISAKSAGSGTAPNSATDFCPSLDRMKVRNPFSRGSMGVPGLWFT